MIRHAVIRCSWDDEAGVWFVKETDIPGLVTEAPTLDSLRLKLPGMMQDLLDLDAPVEIEIDAHHLVIPGRRRRARNPEPPTA